MKFFATSQIRLLDKFTIENEPIASIDLMERAADALFYAFVSNFPFVKPVCILAGPGNNGGDALALARKLLKSGYKVSISLLHSGKTSTDCEINRLQLISEFPTALIEWNDKFVSPNISKDTIILDGLFGSGLSRPIEGIYAEAIKWINQIDNQVVSIDIPSGLQGEINQFTENSIVVKANVTLSLQFPKLAYLFVENEKYVGQWEILDIGILSEAIEVTHSNLYFLEKEDISKLLKVRSKFSHKGTFGHALIFSGCKGMAGASVLSSSAGLKAGAGLVTIHGPECNRLIVQTANPEIIFQSDKIIDFITSVENLDKYNAIAIGPGIGMHEETATLQRNLLKEINKPCVIDADALNIIAQKKSLLDLIPENSILTPHPKEFERIFGKSNSSYERMIKAQEAAQKYKVIIVLKGAFTLIAMPDAILYFNSTGNSGMATAGSGDVLTGILVGLLAQGYLPVDAAKIGVYLHGLAGDLALKKESPESLIAGDIIKNIGKAFKSLG
ncbi:MAG: NAD(P)H-hydrate dehydratase [Paludibacter sp.]|nr:NAD(P)H-hydrate dehydratase [Paludibacter sp.]